MRDRQLFGNLDNFQTALCRFSMAGVMMLSACVQTADTAATLRVANKSITVAAPDGYCLDRQSADVSAAGGFVLFGDCRLLDVDLAGGDSPGTVITASVTTEGLNGTLQELRQFLTTEPGKIMLGRSGQMHAIHVRRSIIQDDILLIKVEDSGPQPILGVSPVIWRGFFLAGGRVITTTVSGSAAADVTDFHAIRLIGQLATRTRAINVDGVTGSG
ncbi:hypothetical protein [Halovulum sp. GXIMD14793]